MKVIGLPCLCLLCGRAGCLGECATLTPAEVAYTARLIRAGVIAEPVGP